MARRRKQDGGDIGFFLLVLAIIGVVLLTVAVYATPFIIVIGLLCYEIRTRRISKNFAFDSDELRQLQDIEEELESVNRRLSEIEEEGGHLKRNLDGTFHRGSRLGMALNAELEQYTPHRENLQAMEESIVQRPFDTFEKWAHVASLRFALRSAAVAYVGVSLSLYLFNPGAMKALSQFVGQYVLVHFSRLNDAWYGSGMVSALVTALLVPVVYFVRRHQLESSAEATMERAQPQDDEPQYDHSGGDDSDPEEEQAYENGQTDSVSPPRDRPWHETLGVSPTASAEEINAAWRDRIKKSHPDRVAELDADFKSLAEQKAKMLNAAREEGLRQRA